MFEGVEFNICVNIDGSGSITEYLTGYGVAEANNGTFQHVFTVDPNEMNLDRFPESHTVVGGRLVEKEG